MKQFALIFVSLALCSAYKRLDLKAARAYSSRSWLDRIKYGPEGPSHFARKPGGNAVTLTEKEMQRDAQARHASCDFPILDAKDPLFLQRLHNMTFRPLLIINGIPDWDVQNWTQESWVQNAGGEEALEGVYPWHMDRPTDVCGPRYPGRAGDYYNKWNKIGKVRADGAAEFVEDNGVIWERSHALDREGRQLKGSFPEKQMPAPTFLPDNVRRVMSYHAHGTSNGFHKHPTTQWLTELNGFKSWYFMPPETWTYPEDYTAGFVPDTGFWHEHDLSIANTVCGYRPQVELMKRHLQTCVSGPGEIVIVPKQWWHATCGLGQFTVATGGVAHEDTAKGPWRAFPQEDSRHDDFMTLRKHFLSFPPARKPQEAMAEKMAGLLLQSGFDWKSIVFRIYEAPPNPNAKSVFFYNDHPYPVDLYAKRGSGKDISVAKISPYGVVGQETDSSWSFSAKRADGSGLQQYSVMPGGSRSQHVVFGQDTVASYEDSDMVIPELQTWAHLETNVV